MVGGIRAAAPQDFEAIERIENRADQLFIDLFQPAHWEPAPAGAARAAEPGFMLVAVDDAGIVVGFAHVLEVDGIAHLEQLSVPPEHGRRGYGRALVEAAKDEALGRGYDRLTLRTFADVPWNGPFYARFGFVQEEPATAFHHELVAVEHRLGLDKYGRRVQMSAPLR